MFSIHIYEHIPQQLLHKVRRCHEIYKYIYCISFNTRSTSNWPEVILLVKLSCHSLLVDCNPQCLIPAHTIGL